MTEDEIIVIVVCPKCGYRNKLEIEDLTIETITCKNCDYEFKSGVTSKGGVIYV